MQCTAAATRTVTLAATVGTGDNAVTHVSAVSIECAQQGSITGLEDASGSGTATVTVSDGFTVTPAAAQCTPTATMGTATASAGAGGERTASAAIAAVAGRVVSSVVSVDCTPPVIASATFAAVYADGCDSTLGVLADGVTERSGTIATTTRCRSPQRRTDGGTATAYYARRHSFELTNPATVTIDLGNASSNSSRLDTYVLLQQGRSQDGTGLVLGRDDDSGPRLDSRIAGSEFAPGLYTIEATTYGSFRTGNYDLRSTRSDIRHHGDRSRAIHDQRQDPLPPARRIEAGRGATRTRITTHGGFMSSTQPMSRRRFLAVVGGTGGALGVAGLGGWRLLGGGEGSGPAAGGLAVDPGVEIVEVQPGFADATVWNDELLTLRAATDGSGIVLRSETTDTDHPVDAPDGFAARCVGVIDDTIVIGGHRNVEFARTAFESGIEYETLLRSAGPQAQTLLDQPSRPITYPHEHVSIGRSATVTHTNDLEAWRNQTINMSDGTGASLATIFPSSVTFALERYSDPEHADSIYEVALVNFDGSTQPSWDVGF